jgi:hypothetical protein
MQDQSFSRAVQARPPLYPPRFAYPVPQRPTPHPQPESAGLTREMLRDIVIEQIG